VRLNTRAARRSGGEHDDAKSRRGALRAPNAGAPQYVSGHKARLSENDAACPVAARAHAGLTSSSSTRRHRVRVRFHFLHRPAHACPLSVPPPSSFPPRLASRLASIARTLRRPRAHRSEYAWSFAHPTRRTKVQLATRHLRALFRDRYFPRWNQTGSQCALFPEKRVIAITSADACDRPDRTSARQTSDDLPLSGPPHYRIFVTQRKKRPWLKVRASPPPAFVRFREERHSR
jgi:hypothetical protein